MSRLFRARIRGDHPRVRGEHAPSRSALMSLLGSSPRARGAHLRGTIGIDEEGIIPACAGSTHHVRAAHVSLRDHPRVRGEHCSMLRAWGSTRGSSPRARGAQAVIVPPDLRQGIIPACAGSTTPAPGAAAPDGDHPRVRGEHPSTTRARWLITGSSPRARGARRLLPVRRQRMGIIPACAGSTGWHGYAADRDRDHPRVRGEHTRRVKIRPMGRGSSPRARGAHPVHPVRLAPPGIIPACAGSTQSHPSPTYRGRDHPRVRGEHYRRLSGGDYEAGSSPRARGAPRTGSARERAGRDHPRVRGEHTS